MASNTSHGPAKKGSKRGIQLLSLDENKEIMDKCIGGKLIWFSPIGKDNFKEYRMNSPILLGWLGIDKNIKDKHLKGFWPSPQPEWDGIAMDTEKRVLYLFEAKSHLSEILPRKGGEPSNNKIIHTSIMSTASSVFGIKDTPANRQAWCVDYYQIANRITFQQKLKTIANECKVSFIDVKMVFLNFVNDRTWDSSQMVSTSTAWNLHYDKIILPSMNVDRKELTEHGIYIVNIDLDLLSNKVL